jgi:hypothetical protein
LNNVLICWKKKTKENTSDGAVVDHIAMAKQKEN